MSDPTADAVLDLYHQGMSGPEIALHLDIPSYKVRLLLKERGVILQGGKRSDKHFHLAAINEMLAKGLNMKEIAAFLEIPYTTINRWCREEHLVTDHDDATRLKAVEMFRAGSTVKDIASKLGEGQKKISIMLHEAGLDVKIPGRRPGFAPKKLLLFEQVKQLHDQEMTVYQIAQAVGVHVDTVGIWLREEGIAPRYAAAHESKEKGVDPRTSPLRDEGLRLWGKGFTEQSISKVLDVPVGTVRSWVSRSGNREGGKRVAYAKETVRAIEMYRQGLSVEEIRKALKRSYYTVNTWLMEAGLISKDKAPSFGICAKEGCDEPVLSPDHKYCTEEHRRDSTVYGREKDPANYVTFRCEECDKEVTRRRKYGNGEHRLCGLCAARANRAMYYVVDQESTVICEKGFETLFYGMCRFLKVTPVERFDRKEAITFIKDDGRNGLYGPDFVVDGLYVEVKGDENDDDRARYAAWRSQKGSLAVVDRLVLDQLRKATKAEFLKILQDAASPV